MANPIWSYLFGVFLIMHGIGHTAGFWVGTRTFGILWLVGLFGFVAAGLAFFGIWVPHTWWSVLAVASAVVSTALILVFVPGTGIRANALIANVGILLAVLWWHWPAPIRGT